MFLSVSPRPLKSINNNTSSSFFPEDMHIYPRPSWGHRLSLAHLCSPGDIQQYLPQSVKRFPHLTLFSSGELEKISQVQREMRQIFGIALLSSQLHKQKNFVQFTSEEGIPYSGTRVTCHSQKEVLKAAKRYLSSQGHVLELPAVC